MDNRLAYLHFHVNIYVYKRITHCSASLYLFLTCCLDSQFFRNIRFSSHTDGIYWVHFFLKFILLKEITRLAQLLPPQYADYPMSSLLLVICTTFSLLSNGRCGEDLMFRTDCAFSRMVQVSCFS